MLPHGRARKMNKGKPRAPFFPMAGVNKEKLACICDLMVQH
jgi:hypothetical protein